jgi:arylsulfatase A-like enzyme
LGPYECERIAFWADDPILPADHGVIGPARALAWRSIAYGFDERAARQGASFKGELPDTRDRPRAGAPARANQARRVFANLRRLGLLLSGGTLTASALAVVEAAGVRRHVEAAAAQELTLGRLAAALAAVLLPAALAAAASALFVSSLLDVAALRRLLAGKDRAPEQRAVVASGALLAVLGAFVWMLGTAHAARVVLAQSSPMEAGARLALGSVLIVVVVAVAALALVPVVARVLGPREASGAPRMEPLVTTVVAVALAGALFGFGVATGEPSGARGTLGIFGVLRRSELDLRPVVHALVFVFGTWAAGAGLDRAWGRAARERARERWAAAVAAMPVLLSMLLFAGASTRLNGAPELALAIREKAPLGGLSLAVLQRLSDCDGDGFSSLFGGGDCDDGDARINPAAVDVPGNGVDEDCSGADTPPADKERKPPPPAPPQPGRSYNVLLITIDALRFDLGFMGHPRPISPNLDALAAKGTVFENAYATASMTWQSMGALMIGRYPSENGGYERFNHFAPARVTVTERLKAAGVRTFAGMCQFAFSKPNPHDVPRDKYTHIGHGFDVWDTSADPNPNGWKYEDDAVTSGKVTDAAIALMQDPENVGSSKRFFAWFHYFDPHTQYVAHAEAPDFSTDDKSAIGRDRALYESEVWFADHHVGRLIDFVSRQPWSNDTAVIVTGDHGEAFGEHGMRWHRKELWEELVHVPLIVYVPGQEPRRIAARRSHIDIARTILDLAGVAPPDDGSLRGESLLPDVLSPPGYVPRERDVYAEIVSSEDPVRRMLITGPGRGMKIIHRGGRSYQLFDLDADPGEKTDLSSKPERLATVLERFQKFRSGLQEIPWTPKKKKAK